MAKISNKDKYIKQDPVNARDYFVLTDYLTGKTKHIEIGGLEVVQVPPPHDPETDENGNGIGILTSGLNTWLKFADDDIGTNMSDLQEGKTHIGIAFRKALPESQDPNSNDPTYYIWTPIGGVISYIGADGKTYYIHVKYSDSPNGTDMVDEIGILKYIGLSYGNTSPTESDETNDYEWSLILSDIEETPKVLYYWIKFADDNVGTNMSDSAVGKTYMGISEPQNTPIESDDPTYYVWNPIQGEQGYTGADGKTYYNWVKWANSKTPLPLEMFDDPEGMGYMGLAVNKETSVESTDYTDYDWSKTADNIDHTDQNNLIRTIDVEESELTSLDEEGFADWINNNIVKIDEDEIVAIEVKDVEVIIPTLDINLNLILTIGAVDETTAVINWNPNGDDSIVRYEVFYVRTKGGEYKTVSLLDVLTTTLTGLDSGAEYEVYVIAYDTLGNTKQSNTETFKTDEVFVASTPNIQFDTVTDTTIDLSWNIEASFNADRYELYQVGTGKIYDGSATSFHVSSLIQDTTYQFYVIAFSGVTQSNDSATIQVDTLLTVDPPLTAPVLTILGTETNSIKFSVYAPDLELPRITQYQLEYRELNQPNWFPAGLSSLTLYELFLFNPDTTYELRARSYDGNLVSDWSAIVLATTKEERRAFISLHIRRVFTQQEIDDNYTGQLTIIDGVPNSIVDIQLLDIETFPQGTVIFKTLIIEGTSKVLKSGTPKIVRILLDENGEYNDIFKFFLTGIFVFFNVSGIRQSVSAEIITSANGYSELNKKDTQMFVDGIPIS